MSSFSLLTKFTCVRRVVSPLRISGHGPVLGQPGGVEEKYPDQDQHQRRPPPQRMWPAKCWDWCQGLVSNLASYHQQMIRKSSSPRGSLGSYTARTVRLLWALFLPSKQNISTKKINISERSLRPECQRCGVAIFPVWRWSWSNRGQQGPERTSRPLHGLHDGDWGEQLLTWHHQHHVHPEGAAHAEEEKESRAESAGGLPAPVSVQRLLQEPSYPGTVIMRRWMSRLSPTRRSRELQCRHKRGSSSCLRETWPADRRADSVPCAGWWRVWAAATHIAPRPGVAWWGATRRSGRQFATLRAQGNGQWRETSFLMLHYWLLDW